MKLSRQAVAKLYYFGYFASSVCVVPYLPLFYASLGFSERQLGVLAAVRPWVSAAASNVGSGLADHLHAHRAIFVGGYAASTLLRMALGGASSFATVFLMVAAANVVGAPVGVLADTAVVQAAESEDDYGRQRLWGAVGWGLLSPLAGALVTRCGLGSAFVAYGTLATLNMANVLALRFDAVQGKRRLKHKDSSLDCAVLHDEGRGDGAGGGGGKGHEGADGRHSDSDEGEAAPLLAVEMQQLHADRGAGDTGAAGGPQGAEAAAARTRRDGHGPTAGAAPARQRGAALATGARASFARRLWTVLSTPATALFLGQALVMGYGVGTIDGFLNLWLQSLGGSELLIGLTLTFTCMAEVPLFHYSGTLLRRCGVPAVLHMVLAAFLLRLTVYACLPLLGTPWAVLAVEPLHGVTFGCAWAAGLHHSKAISPPGLEATTQALFQSCYMGLGHGVGGLTGGFVYEAYGLQAVFVVAAAAIAAGWAVCGGTQAFVCVANRRRQRAEVIERPMDCVPKHHDYVAFRPDCNVTEA